MAATNPVFKFSREAFAVIVERIPREVDRREIVNVFSTLVGDIRNVEDKDGGRSMEITFYTHDAARKALCMSGYTISGVPLSVTAIAPPKTARGPNNGNRSADARRNLYVLGLPFDLSKAEFQDVFARYGTVSHCVILATVDNASRRRGFIVMSTNAEARAAMEGLSRTEMKGSIIDVSWAVVQRSQGFLDGGDRALPTRDVPAEDIPQPQEPLADTTHALMTSIVVSNLPTLIFSQPTDIEPLFLPFGDVKRLERLSSAPASAPAYSGLFSVIVTYATPDSAREAKDMLHGQVYGNQALFVEIVNGGSPVTQMKNPGNTALSTAPPASRRPQQKWLADTTNKSSNFNPRASPFIFDPGLFAASNSAPPTCTIPAPRLDYFDTLTSNNIKNNHGQYDESVLPPSLSHSKSRSPIPAATGLAIPSEAYQPQPSFATSNLDWALKTGAPRSPFLRASDLGSQYPLRSSSAASWWSASGLESGSTMHRNDSSERDKENNFFQARQGFRENFFV